MSGVQRSGHKVARPAARYRPGKAPALPPPGPGGASSSRRAPDADADSDSDEEQEEVQQQQAQDVPITDISAGAQALRSANRQTAGIVIQQGVPPQAKVEEDLDSSEYETDTDEEPEAAAPPRPVFRRPGAPAQPEPPAGEESSEYETDSEEESEEEGDAKPPPLVRPTFVPKRLRETLQEGDDAAPADEAEAEAKAEAQRAERRQQAHALAAERIKADLASKEFQDAQPDLSDTDDKDPEAEFQAWRLRELQRLARARESEREKEEAKREVERRREMPEEQRLKEDLERAKKSRAEKKKADIGFMQKYHHKGAFFQDMDILKRDYSGPTESTIDKSSLPALMQVRDYGKASRSKWTHLAAEDTTRRSEDPRFRPAGSADRAKAAGAPGASSGSGSGGTGAGCFICGGPHLKRECPQAGGAGSGDGPSRITGSNNVETRRERSWGARPGEEPRPPDRDRGRGSREEGGDRRERARESADYDRDRERDRERERHRDRERGHDRDSRR